MSQYKKAEEVVERVLEGGPVHFGQHLTIEKILDGSYQLDSTAPIGSGPIMIHWADFELLSQVLTVLVDAAKGSKRKGDKATS